VNAHPKNRSPNESESIVTTNWAGNVAFSATDRIRPRSIDAVVDLVTGSRRLHAVGSGHSFSEVADTDGLHVDVSRLELEPELRTRGGGPRTVVVPAGWTYWQVSVWLHERGYALRNLASLPHISVAGSVATGTHGSGARNQSLAAQVRGIRLVDGLGQVRTLVIGDAAFDGAVVSLGLLGIVVAVELEVVPAFELAQYVTLRVPLRRVQDDLSSILSLGYSTSVFTRWSDDRNVDSVWVKTEDGASHVARGVPATADIHPVITEDAANTTAQLGVRGPWHERLPHFRPDHSPSTGAELQSEFFVAAEHGPAMLTALRAIAPEFSPALQVNEIRAVAADRLWLSGAEGRDCVAFHFTWRPDLDRVLPALRLVEDAAERFDARPHWGKLTTRSPERIAAAYPRWEQFLGLRAAMDPEDRFVNAFARRLMAPGETGTRVS